MTDLTEVKEFVAETRDEAIAKASSHFGVGAEELDVYEVPGEVEVAGLGGRSLVIASKREESAELGVVGEFVQELLQRMNAGRVRLRETETEDGEIVIRASGGALAEMVRREGYLGSALSHLADRAAIKLVHEDASARVELEIESRDDGRGRGGRGREGRRDTRGGGGRDRDRDRDGRRGGRDRDRDGGRGGRDRDRDRRPRRAGEAAGGGLRERGDIDEAGLELLALRAAVEVRDSGQVQLLREMNSRERWVVHNALKEESGVRSESEGEGPLRRVKILPA